MNRRGGTLPGYFNHLFWSMRRNPGGSALAMLSVVMLGALYAWIAGMLLAQQSEPSLLAAFLGSFVPVVVAMILVQFFVAAWRLNGAQQVSIDTKQALLDLQEIDHIEAEQILRTTHAMREQRLHDGHEAYVKTLNSDIVDLSRQIAQLRRSEV